MIDELGVEELREYVKELEKLTHAYMQGVIALRVKFLAKVKKQ